MVCSRLRTKLLVAAQAAEVFTYLLLKNLIGQRREIELLLGKEFLAEKMERITDIEEYCVLQLDFGLLAVIYEFGRTLHESFYSGSCIEPAQDIIPWCII